MEEMLHCLLLTHLFVGLAGAGSPCVPVQCVRCVPSVDTRDSCPSCNSISCIDAAIYANISTNCKKAFWVSINSTGSEVQEGDDVTLTCAHNLPIVTLGFGWSKDGNKILEKANKSELLLTKVTSSDAGQYVCFVNASCGDYESSPHAVTVDNNNVLLIVVCGVSAMVVVLIMALAMKFKLKSDNAKHKQRMEERAQNRAPPPFPPSSSQLSA